jgi:hypothetical protein
MDRTHSHFMLVWLARNEEYDYLLAKIRALPSTVDINVSLAYRRASWSTEFISPIFNF